MNRIASRSRLLPSLAGTLALSVAALAASLVLAPAGLAHAQQNAGEWYQQGVKHYNLGEFEKAIDAFKKAYDGDSNPAYLYNIAQAYRQLGDCKNALFFYKRFLSLRGSDPAKPLKPELKTEIETRIAELDKCVKDQDALKGRPPDAVSIDGNPQPGGGGGGTTGGGTTGGGTTGGGTQVAGGGDGGGDGDGDGDGEEDGDGEISASTEAAAPTLLSARLGLGGSKIGAGEVAVPVQFAVALTGGYPLALGDKLTLEPGAGFGFSPVPYNVGGGTSSTATLTSLFANVGATYAAAPKVGVHGALGVGVMMFGGLVDGNPFTMGGAGTTGALTMLHVRVAVTGEYAVTPNIVVGFTPAFGYSPPKDGLIEAISSLTRLDFLATVGYRR
ncbi:MAG: tetratricopeptide repeat protein [Kofleriaceae bacterium]|jgi:hypothetical protein|nr:tetratricopeptide repeat protein [Kofleriaceae bacterium]